MMTKTMKSNGYATFVFLKEQKEQYVVMLQALTACRFLAF